MKLDNSMIDYITDISPYKINKYTPLSRIPIVHDNILKKIKNKSNIFIAYEPVWAIGTGIIPKSKDLYETVNYIKSKFKGKPPRVLYGGSVNPNNIKNLKEVSNIDGFLIGGASQNANKFIDIVKKTYS